MEQNKGQEVKKEKKYKTLKEVNRILKFPLWLKRYVDNGGITRYELVNLVQDNYWVKPFYSKEEVLEYFNTQIDEVTSSEVNK